MTQEADIDSNETFRKISGGDRPAFGRLFNLFYVRLCLYAESIVRDSSAAEDIVQNVFCLLWEKRESLNIGTSVKSYLYRSVYNNALNVLKHDRVKQDFLKFIQEYRSESEFEPRELIDRESREALLQEVDKAIEQLPGQCREVFLLSRFSGKKAPEIAEIMHLSLRTVENHLYRATRQLRAGLQHLKHSFIYYLFFLKKVE